MDIRSSRRQFLQVSAGAVGAAFAVNAIPLESAPFGESGRQVSASDRVRFGMIGVGMRDPACSHAPSPSPVSNVPPPAISTTGATRARVKSSAPTCGRRAGTRSCWPTRRLTASSRRCPITGIGRSWWMP